jgi:hypothetical protein
VLIGNISAPIKLAGLQLNGVSGVAARDSDTIQVWTRLYLTSDDRFFHRMVENLNGHVEYVARPFGGSIPPAPASKSAAGFATSPTGVRHRAMLAALE